MATACHPSTTAALDLASEAETQALGHALAGVLGVGDTVLLSGGLGAGKSALARAVVRACLSAPEAEVPSPSYTLINVYETPSVQIWHGDLYRLTAPEEVGELGLEDAFDHALVLLEWPERLGEACPARHLQLGLTVTGEHTRRVEIAARGPGWQAVLAALSPWMEGKHP